MTTEPSAESTHEAVVWAIRKEEGYKVFASIMTRLAGLITRGGYLFTVVAVAIIVPLLIIWSLVS